MSTDQLFRRWAKAREGAMFLGFLLLLFPAAAVAIALTGRDGAASEPFAMIVMWGVVYALVWVAILVRAISTARALSARGVTAALRRERLRSLAAA